MTDRVRVLLVDDEVDFVDYMTRHLKANSLDVLAFNNPVRALEETGDQVFDVGLLDLKMPGMDGEELLRRFKQRDPGMEIIILTGHPSIESAFRTSKNGAYEYLNKPCDFDVLLGTINKAYAKRIKNLNRNQSERVDTLMKSASRLSPLELLKRLKGLRKSKKRR